MLVPPVEPRFLHSFGEIGAEALEFHGITRSGSFCDFMVVEISLTALISASNVPPAVLPEVSMAIRIRVTAKLGSAMMMVLVLQGRRLKS